ncbi:MAG: hypothetical protein V1737_03935 [Chloroflexota bacterium]
MGAPKGNQNARKHGFYSQLLNERERAEMEAALEVENLDTEIAILRVKLRRLIREHPERLDLQLAALGMMARLFRAQHNVPGRNRQSLKAAMSRILTEVAIPAGIKVIRK